jgi:hypothetical protein
MGSFAMISGGGRICPNRARRCWLCRSAGCQETCILFGEDSESWQRTSNEHLRRTQVMFEIDRMSKETSRKWGVSLGEGTLTQGLLSPIRT